MNATKTCERCNTEFECNAECIAQCTCAELQLTPEELAYINRKYAGCICNQCLKVLQKEFRERKA